MHSYQPDLATPKPQTIENQPVNEASRVAGEQVAADWEKIRTTQRKQFIESHKTTLTDEDLTIFSKPRNGCSHCYGTGVEGAYTMDSHRLPGQPCLCRCLTNKLLSHPEQIDDNRLTYGAFKQLMASARQRYNPKESENETRPIESSEEHNEVGSRTDQGDGKEVDPGATSRETGRDNQPNPGDEVAKAG